MKILIAAEVFPPHIGGGATYTYNLVYGLIEAGHKISLIYYGKKFKAKMPGIVKLKSVSLKLPRLIRYCSYFLKLLFLSRKIKVIYALGPVFSGWPALLVKKLTNKHLVVRIIGDETWEKGVGWSKIVDSIEVFQKKKSFGDSKLPLIKNIQMKVAQACDLIIVQSFYFKKMVCGWLGGCGHSHKDNKCVNSKIRLIYNSIYRKFELSISKEDAQKHIGIKGDILLAIANTINRKGVVLLIRLMPSLLRVNKDFKLVIVGKSDFLDFFRVLVKELGLDKNIFLMGQVPFKQIIYYYKAASLFLLNSKYEGLPFVLLEALEYKVPIVCSRVGGVAEVVDDGVNGMLVDYDNDEAWFDAITKLWNDKPTQECFKACNVTSLGVFSRERMIKDTVDALLSVTGNS